MASSLSGKITDFRSGYSFLSNFYKYPLLVSIREPFPETTTHAVITLQVPTAEHAYQYMKVRWDHPDAEKWRTSILATKRPAVAKAIGKDVPLRLDWEYVKLHFMEQILRVKFPPGGQLSARLVATHPHELIELNWWKDTYWGVDTFTGEGENHLGELLMKLRDELRGKR